MKVRNAFAAFGLGLCLNTMAFNARPPIGGLAASPLGSSWCSVSSAIGLVAGSFFSEKYSETPLAGRGNFFEGKGGVFGESVPDPRPAGEGGGGCLKNF